MRILYTILTDISSVFLWGAQFFSPKMKLFIQGRKQVYEDVKKGLEVSDKVIWFHCASLGEFEQGVPIMEALRKALPSYKLLVTFFSPSGYEIKKDSPVADAVCYLPLDTKRNAKKFLKIPK